MPIDQRRLDPRGQRLRQTVIGDHAVRAIADADDFTGPLQEVITNHAWGKVWSRPGITRKTRSLVTIALLTALNRPAELRLHVAGAVRNGCTTEEIRETLLHCSVYCGIPAAVDAFAVARDVLAAMRAERVGGKKPATKRRSRR